MNNIAHLTYLYNLLHRADLCSQALEATTGSLERRLLAVTGFHITFVTVVLVTVVSFSAEGHSFTGFLSEQSGIGRYRLLIFLICSCVGVCFGISGLLAKKHYQHPGWYMPHEEWCNAAEEAERAWEKAKSIGSHVAPKGSEEIRSALKKFLEFLWDNQVKTECFNKNLAKNLRWTICLGIVSFLSILSIPLLLLIDHFLIN